MLQIYSTGGGAVTTDVFSPTLFFVIDSRFHYGCRGTKHFSTFIGHVIFLYKLEMYHMARHAGSLSLLEL